MQVIAIILGLAIAFGATIFLDALPISQINSIQEQTQLLAKLIMVCFGNTLIWLGILAPKNN